MVYLFDHALLMVKQKSKHEQYKVYRRVSSNFPPQQIISDARLPVAHPVRATLHLSSRRKPPDEPTS